MKPFGVLLREAREREGRNVRSMADSAGVAKHVYQMWEDGLALPSRFLVKKMFGGTHPILHHLPKTPSELAPRVGGLGVHQAGLSVFAADQIQANAAELAPPEESESAPESELTPGVDVDLVVRNLPTPMETRVVHLTPAMREAMRRPPPPPVMPQPARTDLGCTAELERPVDDEALFHLALAAARAEARITQEDLGVFVGVTGQAVSAWETGRVVPILEHYHRLLDYLPALRAVPPPPSQDIPKPNGAHEYVPPLAPRLPPPPPPSDPAHVAEVPVERAPDGLDLLDRALKVADRLRSAHAPHQAIYLRTRGSAEVQLLLYPYNVRHYKVEDAEYAGVGVEPRLALVQVFAALRKVIDARREKAEAEHAEQLRRIEAERRELEALSAMATVGR
jgi:DNA-binding XRE family transcriptional regulator